jgi:predicted AAA+ superfamily ATPase
MAPAPAYPRLARLPRSSFFLFGPRGVGKSFWARRALPEAHLVDLLDETRYHELVADASLFAAELRTVRPRSWVIVDEVQRVPGLLNEVHRFIEDRGLRFALLGSSARKLRAAGTNLLGGRAIHKRMFPLVPHELGKDFDLDAVLTHGSMPVVWMAPDRRRALDAYVQTYLREEIRAEAVVRQLPGFLRFLPVAAAFHGQVVNVSGIARDCGVARTTVEGYLEILEDTLLGFRLPAYEPRLRTRERKHPKLYWVDPGLVRAVKKQLGPLAMEERGPLLEGWVLGLLRAHGEEGGLYDEIWYWSPARAGSVEVDFVLRRGGDLIAIEVKSRPRFGSDLLVGLRAIAELAALRRRVLVHPGARVLRTADGIDVWPIAQLAAVLARGRLWP